MFDQALAGIDSRARHHLAERRLAEAEANIERLVLLDEILDVALDTGLDDAAVGAGVRGLGPDRLAAAVRAEDERLPRDGGHLALLEARFAHVRSFAPQVLAALSFRASVASETLDAVAQPRRRLGKRPACGRICRSSTSYRSGAMRFRQKVGFGTVAPLRQSHATPAQPDRVPILDVDKS